MEVLLGPKYERLSSRVTYQIARLAKALEGERKILNETRNSLIKKHANGNLDKFQNPSCGFKDESNPTPEEAKRFRGFNDEFNKFLDEGEEVDINAKSVELPPESEIPAAVFLDLDGLITVHTVKDEPKKEKAEKDKKGPKLRKVEAD
jgi:hypothetical protein